MNKFELFCMIFYVLDAEWDDTKDGVIGDYLSAANPFLFEDIGSAEPSVYLDFCRQVGNEFIPVEHSFDIAWEYIQKLNESNIEHAFRNISKEEWNESVREYLSMPHKGESI